MGDLIVGDTEQGIEYLKQIPGKIHIILGNHDTLAKAELYRQLPNVVDISYAQPFKYKKYHFFLCHYPTCTAFTPSRPASNTLFNLFGHTHQQTNFFSYGGNEAINCRMYHVGVDSHGCKPVSIDQIIQDLLDACPDNLPQGLTPEERAEIAKKKKEEKEKIVARAEKLVSEEYVLDQVAAAQADGRLPSLIQVTDMDTVVKLMPELLADIPAETPELKKAVCRLGNQFVRKVFLLNRKE